MNISCEATMDESGHGLHDGEGQVTITGGLPPYNITWTGPVSGTATLNADGTFVFTGLSAGLYVIQVQDSSGCISICQFVINSPCDLTILDIQSQNATCPEVNNGTITVSASGGQIPYQYSLDGINFQSSNIFSGLAPGNYVVFVKDDVNCTANESIEINAGPGPQLSITEIINASCGVQNGSIEVEGSGGSEPYMYSIDGVNFGFSNLFPGLGAGNYVIYLIDDAGCRASIPATVIAANAPVINSVTPTNSSCGQSDGSIVILASGVVAY
jgi:hypothetical protein